MYLNLDSSVKLVFSLRKFHEKDFSYVKKAQKLTLDKSKPMLGLAGHFGLYGSKEWWENIDNGEIRHKVVSGIIIKLYKAGMDRTGKENSFILQLDTGEMIESSIYVNNEDDISLFSLGKRVYIFYIYDLLKPAEDEEYIDLVVEMAVSIEPVLKNKKGFFSSLFKW